MTDYIKIDWADVRAGDVLKHKNGDRVTVYSVAFYVTAAGITRNSVEWDANGFAPHRKRPELPTAFGLYIDRHEDTWKLTADGWDDGMSLHSTEDMAARAPFTRLVPMPTEADVRAAIDSARISSGFLTDEATAAVMALLTGKEADSE